VREVKLLKMLSHPNIIGYLEDFIDNNNLCIIMEYAQGIVDPTLIVSA